MPVPVILAGLAAAGAAVLGAGAHIDAKETNEIATAMTNEAKKLYDDAKESLEKAQQSTEKSLLKLGTSKKQVLELSMAQFLTAYDRIKNIELSDSVGLDEIENFAVEKQDTLQLREMSNIYESTFSSGVTGAAAGAVIALAASGSLPIVTGTLSIAGSALAAGEIGMAAGLAGSALSVGAAMTPLAAVAAPVVLFTGISASMKADENLEKARTIYAEAEEATEKMKTSEVLCTAIADRADMFDNLLSELNGMFSYCTGVLDGLTRKKMGIFKHRAVDAKTFTEDELKLVAVTRSLAGAVKAVIDTPILTSNGVISTEAETVYENTTLKLAAFTEAVEEVKTIDYSARPVTETVQKSKKSGTVLEAARNVAAVLIGLLATLVTQEIAVNKPLICLMVFGITTLLIMNNDAKNLLFKVVKHICCISIALSFVFIFYYCCQLIVSFEHYLVGSIILGLAAMLIFGGCLPDKGKEIGNIRRTAARFFGCAFFFFGAVLVYAILYKFIGISHDLSVALTTLVYALFAFLAVYSVDVDSSN